MLLPGDAESTSTVCSCYAPVSLLGTRSCEARRESKVAAGTAPVMDHANEQGEGARAEPSLPLPPAPPTPPPLRSPLKSNLKKPVGVGEQHQEQVMVRNGRRKVTWPDAHGRDIAHVQVFHSSALEEGEFAMTGKSCICSIQ